MGTALTQEQLAELSRAVGSDGSVYLALDADSAGQDAMLRAGRGARERGVELRVIAMPEGTDPAELVASDGAEAFEELLGGAVTVHEFEVQRRLAIVDAADRVAVDRAVGDMREILQSVDANSVLRDHLVRIAADKLDVLPDNLHAMLDSPTRPARSGGTAGGNGVAVSAPEVDQVAAIERTFLAMCMGDATNGREYLERLEEDHFSSGALRRARDHLVGHFEDPLGSLPDDDPTLAALITDVVMRGSEEYRSADVLRLTFLQLEYQRVKRQLWHAERDRALDRQRELWPVRESIRLQIDELMGRDL
jgi:DNA primase